MHGAKISLKLRPEKTFKHKVESWAKLADQNSLSSGAGGKLLFKKVSLLFESQLVSELGVCRAAVTWSQKTAVTAPASTSQC